MILYTKSNPHRKPEFRLETTIHEVSGKRFVQKKASTVAAKQHLASIIHNYQQLVEYANDSIYILDATLIDDSTLQYDFINHPTLYAIALESVLQEDANALIDLIQGYAVLIRDHAEGQVFTESVKQNLFADLQFSTSAILAHGCIDFNFDNILVDRKKRKYYLFDYEWSVEEPVPAQFVIWRAVLYTYIQLKEFGVDPIVSLDALYTAAGITAEDEKNGVIAEHRFQKWLTGDNFALTIAQLEERFIHEVRKTPQLESSLENIRGRVAAYDALRVEYDASSVHIRNLESQREIDQTAVRHFQDTTQKLQEQLVVTEDQLATKTSEFEKTLLTTQELQKHIEWMEASSFWKLRQYYVRVRSFRIRAVWALVKRAWGVYRQYGIMTVTRYFFLYLRFGRSFFQQNRTTVDEYALWQTSAEQYDPAAITAEILDWKQQPRISIVVPVYNTPVAWLQACVESVEQQFYPNWELCLFDDGSTDETTLDYLHGLEAVKNDRIAIGYGKTNQHISVATNSALALATGDYVGLLDADDELTPWALYEVAKALQTNSEAAILYSDEDKIDLAGRRQSPFFKPDWDPQLLLAMNYMSHFTVYRSDLVHTLGGMRLGFEGAQDYDLLLRATEVVDPAAIIHIPAILYHWRMVSNSTATGVGSKSYAHEKGKQAVIEALDRRGISAVVTDSKAGAGRYHVQYALTNEPLVSIVVPFRDECAVTQRCVESVRALTTYSNYEILLVNNQSVEADTLSWLDEMAQTPGVRVIDYDQPFNFSAINNMAVEAAQGEYVVFLNNDTEVITEYWLTALLEFAQQSHIGAVGALLLYPNNTVQHAGIVLGIGGVAGHAFKYMHPDSPGYFSQLQVARSVSGVTGACLMMRKVVFQEIGGFNADDLAVGFNDVDLCLRIREAGYQIIYTPYARLYHHESISRGTDEGLDPVRDKAKYDRTLKEQHYMLKRWGAILPHDPYYSPHLSLKHEDYRMRLHE